MRGTRTSTINIKNLDVPLYELEMTLFSQAEELQLSSPISWKKN